MWFVGAGEDVILVVLEPVAQSDRKVLVGERELLKWVKLRSGELGVRKN